VIFRGPEGPVAIPDVALTPLLLERAARHGDKPAFIDGATGRTLTYRSWADAVRRTAAGLADRGLRPGDVLAIFSPNLPEYAVAFHAVSLAGGIVTTINPLYTSAELGQQIKDAGARYLVTVPGCLSKVQPAVQGSGLRELFVFGEAEGATPFAALMADGGTAPDVLISPREDLVVLPYSSGTTGLPKGVMLTHYNLVANIMQADSALGLLESDVMLGVLPFFHIYGLLVIMNLAAYVGTTVVTMTRFDLEQFLEFVQRYRITFAPIVPPIVLALAKHPVVEKYDLSSLRIVSSGAAPLGAAVAKAASARLHCHVVQGYGLTETSPVTHYTRTAKPYDVAGIGQPLANTEAKVVDLSTGSELGPNQEGEICVRGPQVMKGYLNQPAATAAMIDGDGWLHTGDVGYADDTGCFFVVDRAKELIKYKGLQVAPAELEAILLSHPCVADAAVVPFPNDEAGEVPKAFVVLKHPAAADDLMAYVTERVAPHKKVRELEVIEQIPKSASGKILRRVLVERDRAAKPSR
jgi:acyl-CoA synthetase (AMP-forming)/AMP-acid ligase II